MGTNLFKCLADSILPASTLCIGLVLTYFNIASTNGATCRDSIDPRMKKWLPTFDATNLLRSVLDQTLQKARSHTLKAKKLSLNLLNMLNLQHQTEKV